MECLNNMIVTEICRTMTVHAAKGKVFQKSGRESYGLSLCISGQITYFMADREFVSVPGYAVLLPRGATYSLHADKAGLFPLINFQCEGLRLPYITIVPLADPDACICDFEQISRLLRSEGGHLEAFSAFYSLLGRLFSPQKKDLRLSPAIACIEARLSDPTLCNRQLADCMGISEIYLRRLFSQQFGTTPKQFILDKRISSAKQLLLDTAMSVTEISDRCGFSSVYHFCRAFKEKTGVTPTEYAKRNRFYKL